MRAWRQALGSRPRRPFVAKPDQGLTDDGPVQGLPIGGLGSGSIGIDYDGRFARWHLNPGRYLYRPSEASFISVERVGEAGGPRALVAPGTRLSGGAVPAGPGTYEALYPIAIRSQPVPDLGLEASVRQWSPVLPHNYVESAWPVGFFEVTLRSASPGRVAVTMQVEVPPEALPPGPASFALGAEGGGLAESDGDPLAARVVLDLRRGEPKTAVFALAWDLPRIHFGPHLERGWWRAHTRQFGTSGRAAAGIVRAALERRDRLAGELAAWHRELEASLARWDAPGWVLPALLNELYLMAEGGTAWLVGRDSAEPGPEEHFGMLECLDYPFYETLDVRYYSSFALLELWPELERKVSDDFVRALAADDDTPVPIQWRPGTTSVRMRAGAAPHDLGAPADDPFSTPNSYAFQDSTTWKDLNPKLVLLLARNLAALKDETLLAAAWPACRQAIRYLEDFDLDRDGVPEHSGIPDQTYDTWPMRGVSAYCGDLWVAALAAAERLARRAGDLDEALRLKELRARAAAVVEAALWTGSHYRFDSSGGPLSEVVMADQLAGTWYAELLGLEPVHPRDRVEQSLATVLAFNFDGFARGRLGPVNGRSPDGGPAGGGEQASEVWVGVAWSIASLCLLTGRTADAWRLGEALYRTLYERSGLWFRTPEAWTENGEFRAAMYHRGLAVWSLVPALRLVAERSLV